MAQQRDVVEAMFAKRGIEYPPKQIFLRIFKQDRQVELWGRGRKQPFKLVRTYEVCAASGDLGPKRRQGDEQVPEGFYRIDRFNPRSNFHLSLGIDYPNQSDRILGHKGSLGGDIFIHGSCVSIGCVAITDDPMETLYVTAVDARSNGQRWIPVHIFPTRMDDAGMARLHDALSDDGDPRRGFWKNLRAGYDFFETKQRLPRVSVAKNGRYRFR